MDLGRSGEQTQPVTMSSPRPSRSPPSSLEPGRLAADARPEPEHAAEKPSYALSQMSHEPGQANGNPEATPDPGAQGLDRRSSSPARGGPTINGVREGASSGPQQATSEDSEAETEILSTPRKQRNEKAVNEPVEDGLSDGPSRKRRASGQPKHEPNEESEYRNGLPSRKKARLVKEEEDYDWDEDGVSEEPEEQHHQKPRLTRKAESESRVHSAREDHKHLASDISRATTVPPKASAQYSSLPKPPQRSSVHPNTTHRRDSSVHVPTTAPRPKDVDRNGRTSLARACHDGDVDRVLNFIATPNDMLNRPDHAGNTPLPLAVAKGHTEVVSILIEAGADVNNVNNQRETPLKDAIDRGDVDVIGLLRRAGAVIKPPRGSISSELPRHRQHFQQPSSTTALLDYINTEDDGGVESCLVDLMDKKVKPNNECVIAAICVERPEYLESMLGFGGEPDPDPDRLDNKTPMIVAIESGNAEAVKLLLQNGADPRRTFFEEDQDYRSLCKELGGNNAEEIYRLLEEAFTKAEAGGTSISFIICVSLSFISSTS